MARAGRFGRLPRSQPSLTNTLIAIAREQQQQRDENIMSAWQKGGMFEGKKVTDEVILAYWKQREGGVSKDDPLYDTYHNAVLQYEYSIAESKMTAKYALLAKPGAGDDAKMSAFYLGWAKKIPKDSEFYRVLQRDAGQYIRAAAAKRSASTQAEAEKRYQSQLNAIETKHEHAGQLALDFVSMLAQRGSGGNGAVLGETPLGNERNIINSTNLANLELPGLDDMMSLLSTVNVSQAYPRLAEGKGAGAQGNPGVLFHDESGKPVTGKDIIAALKAADPTFNGHFDVASLGKMIAGQKEGLQLRIALAKKTGHVTDMMNLQNALAKVNEYGNEIAAWPVLQSYSDLKSQLDGVMKDDSLLPAAKIAAIDRIRADIGKLADDPRIAADDHLQSQLHGEANGVAGTVTAGEDMEGLKGGFSDAQTAQNSEVMNVNSIRETLDQQVQLTLDPNSGYMMTQGDYVSDGKGGVVFQPSPGGHAVGAATQDQIKNLPGAGPAVTVLVPNGDGGGATPMVMVPAAVTATAKKADGTPIALANKNPVATFIKYQVNGVTVTLYGITDAGTGQTRWTNDPPWDTSKVKVTETHSGMQLDLSAYVPKADTSGPTGGDITPGFKVVNKSVGSRSGAGSPGTMEMNPAAAALATQPERQAAGFDPNTDSFSPTLIALKSTPDGQVILKQYAGDPNFAKVIDDDAHRAAGMTPDVNTGAWTGNAAQIAAYGKFSQQATVDLNNAKNGVAPSAAPQSGVDSWWKDTTQTQTTGAVAPPVSNPNLPTEDLRAAADMNQFSALVASFKAGSTAIMPGKAKDDLAVPTIQSPLSLTVPGYTPPNPVTVPTSGVVPTPAPSSVIPTSPLPTSSPTGYNNKPQAV